MMIVSSRWMKSMSTAVNPELNLNLWEQIQLWLLGDIKREGIVDSIDHMIVTIDGQEYWHTPRDKPFKVGDFIEFYAWGNRDSQRLDICTAFREIRILKEA